jgi:hypothetical protein
MQMIRHHHKGMQRVKSPVSATDNLLDDNICHNCVYEKRMLPPGIGRHKVDACLPNPPDNPTHIRTLRG